MIVPAALAPTCRALAATFPGGAGMWTTPIMVKGASTVTHYISSGGIWQQFADMIASPEALAAGAGIPLAQAEAILSACDVSTDDGLVAMERLGLEFAQDVV